MSNNFENAMHHGYSAEDMRADIEEQEGRCRDLGCFLCVYRDRNSPTCDRVRDGEMERCPYYKKEV